MPLVQAKCTNCGANLEVDSTSDAANCEYCKAAFIVEKAINNYNIANAQITAQNVNVNIGANNPQRLKEIAEKSFAVKQYKNAYLDFVKVIELDKSDYEAYWGICRVHMAVYPKIPITEKEVKPSGYSDYWYFWEADVGGMRGIPGYSRIENAYKYAVSYAPKEKANEYKEIISRHNIVLKDEKDKIREAERIKMEENLLAEENARLAAEERHRRNKPKIFLARLIGIIGAVIFIIGFLGFCFNDTQRLQSIVLMAIGAIVIFIGDKIYKKYE